VWTELPWVLLDQVNVNRIFEVAYASYAAEPSEAKRSTSARSGRSRPVTALGRPQHHRRIEGGLSGIALAYCRCQCREHLLAECLHIQVLKRMHVIVKLLSSSKGSSNGSTHRVVSHPLEDCGDVLAGDMFGRLHHVLQAQGPRAPLAQHASSGLARCPASEPVQLREGREAGSVRASDDDGDYDEMQTRVAWFSCRPGYHTASWYMRNTKRTNSWLRCKMRAW